MFDSALGNMALFVYIIKLWIVLISLVRLSQILQLFGNFSDVYSP